MNNVLVVDCNDSFVYNLVQLLRQTDGCRFEVVNVSEIPFGKLSQFSHILLSPGPGVPQNYPSLFRLLDETLSTHSILGVCLGMQTIAEHAGCRLKQLAFPKHGHESVLHIFNNRCLFRHISQQTLIGRYHSWVVDADSVPDALSILALDEEQQIMALRHRRYPVYGVQFHPESVITSEGERIIANWLEGG